MITERRLRDCLRMSPDRTKSCGPFWIASVFPRTAGKVSEDSRYYLQRAKGYFKLKYAIGTDKGGIYGVDYSARRSTDPTLLRVTNDAEGYAELAHFLEEVKGFVIENDVPDMFYN